MTAPSLRVVKFGGSTVGSGRRLAIAAQSVMGDDRTAAIVVVSAPGDLTDRTLGLLAEGRFSDHGAESTRVLVHAEELGAVLFAAALRAAGAVPRLLRPEDPEWPVRLVEGGPEARVDLAATRERFQALRGRLVPGTIVVLPGFVGVDANGAWGTLPRGGGDTTAVVAGRSLGLSEVFLVKDVPGVFTSDPHRDPGAVIIPELSTEEMADRARQGADVVAPDALRYLVPGLDLRVVPLGAPFQGGIGSRIRSADVPSRPATLEGAGDGRSRRTATKVLASPPLGGAR